LIGSRKCRGDENVTGRFWRETKRDPSTALGMTAKGKGKSRKKSKKGKNQENAKAVKSSGAKPGNQLLRDKCSGEI
jgi:hypothetical protein